jgi:1-aminocyclopropane-1-carboxylate deaminase/D-cysteine desulfhydrase-like pyridoxal-dependent ACC family enzyme
MARMDVSENHAGRKPISAADKSFNYFADPEQLTPIEKRSGLFFKRDDLFRPFETKVLNGGKLRQVITALTGCRKPGVITAASIHSPQIPLVAGAAHHLGLRCVAVVGGTSMTTELNMAVELGTEIKRAASGRHRALFAEVTRLNSSLGYHVIPYGIASPTDPACFITQAKQVANLPEDLDTLVVTCGSGMSTIGILSGLWQFSKRVRELVLVAMAPSRSQTISNSLQSADPRARSFLQSLKLTYIDLFGLPGFRYERRVPYTLCGIDLHPLYEAKAFRHVLQKRDCSSRRTVFWIVGADLREAAGESDVT